MSHQIFPNPAGSGSGIDTDLLANDLDVTITDPREDHDVITWNASLGFWANQQPLLAHDADVGVASPNDGDVLTYDASLALWISKAPTADVDSLATLSDVLLTSLATSDFLQYDGTHWVNHALAFTDLSGSATAAQLPTFAGPGFPGIVPDPGSSSGFFLKDDGTWAAGGAGSALLIKISGSSTGVTSIMNLVPGTNIGITNPGAGANIQIAFTGTLAATLANASHKWLNSYDAATGLFTQTQPDYSDLTGTPTLAQTLANASHKWLNSYDAATGLFTQTQPAYTDLTGTPQLPITKTAVASNWIRSYDSSTGLFTASQPAAADLSNGVTGSGAVVLVTSPTLVTPTLGVATATSLAVPLISTSSTQLELSETGDALGIINMYLRNRSGSNGAIFENPSVCLADFGMQTSAIITNIAINGSNVLTVTAAFAPVASSLPAVGQKVTLSGLTTATFLNAQVVTIATISATQFTASFTHALYASAADTGIAVAQNNVRAEFRNDKVLSTLNTSGEIQFFDPTNPGSGTWFASGISGTTIGDSISTAMVTNFQRALMLIGTNAVMNVTRISASMAAASPAVELAHATSNVATPDYFWDIFGSNTAGVEALGIRRRTPEFSHVGSDATIAQFDQNGGVTLPVALISLLGAGSLPVQTNQPLIIAGGFSSPTVAKVYVGDGTGWELDFAKRISSTDTTLFKMKDSGVLDIATGITIAGAATTGNVLRGNGTNFVSAALIAADIPSLDASKITSGTLALAQGGTGADLSGTGATSFVLTQFGLGAPITVRQLASSNLSDGTTGSGTIVLNSSPTLASMLMTGLITKYNNITTVGNGVASEVATVDLTTQAAAIATTTLYAVPASGAGQYRISWDAKITRAATTSNTLGPLTISYTDPDGVVITTTMPGVGANPTTGIGESVSTLSTSAVLFGFTLTLNCKASTNITYAFAYASSGATTMQYNLHIKLEAL